MFDASTFDFSPLVASLSKLQDANGYVSFRHMRHVMLEHSITDEDYDKIVIILDDLGIKIYNRFPAELIDKLCRKK